MSDPCEGLGGRDPIPPRLWITVTVVIIISVVLTAVAANKGWLRYDLVTSDMMQKSHFVSTTMLGAYRMFVTAWILAMVLSNISIGVEEKRAIVYDVRAYTAWNQLTLLAAFLLLSCQHVFTYTPKWMSSLTWTVYQVELCNALFLDIVFWTLLFPGGRVPATMPTFFFVVDAHGINFLWLLGEVALGSLLVVPGQVVFVLLYSLVYIIFSWIKYAVTTECMPYPFLAAGPKTAPAMYLGLCIFLLFIFSMTWALVAVRERAYTGRYWPPSRSASGYTSLV